MKQKFLLAAIAALLVVGFVMPVEASSCSGSHCGYSYSNSYPYSNQYPYNYSNKYPYNYSNQYPYSYQNSSYPYYSGQTPSCSISLSSVSGYSNYSYGTGYPMLLTWSSNNAYGASISPEIGTVSTSGSRIVYVTGQQYSMAVYGHGGTSVCSTGSYSMPSSYSYYQPSYTYPTTYAYPTYQQPIQISLKQIPYTGADFGHVGTALVWLMLVVFASIGAGAIAEYSGLLARARERFQR